MPNGEVFVVVEHERGELPDVTLEMLGDARALADGLGASVCAVVLGAPFDALPSWLESALPAHGADRVLLVEHESLDPYLTEAHLEALGEAVQRFRPTIVLLAATRNGQDLAPRLAARLHAPFAGDCISFRLEADGSLEAVRPVYGDKAHATVRLRPRPGAPCVLTLRPNVAGIGRGRAGRDAPVTRLVPELDPARLRARVLRLIPADPAAIDLAEAEVVVAGGRGVGSAEGWRRIEELADALGASVGATRVAVDLGWAPFERQIGQTGKYVKAKLYVACGVSGASQHALGMQESEVIVAVNTDKAAPIFKLAHLGAVGDLHAILPALVEQIRALRAGGNVER